MKKKILYAPLTETSTAVSNIINISTVEELYAAVDNPAYSGKTIMLAQGHYKLKSNLPHHDGLLKLQFNMSLIGQIDHPELVIIDASELPTESFTIAADPPDNPFGLRKGAVRIGNGRNVIEWMTLQNAPGHDIRSLIQTDIAATMTTHVRIANTIIKGSSIGVNILNWRTDMKGRIVEAEIVNNEIFDNIIPQFGAAIQIQNSHAVKEATINVTITGNYLHGNKSGISVLNGQSSQNIINIRSHGNRIEANGVGIAFRAGLTTRPDFPGNNNSIRFEAHGTTIRHNSGIPEPPENLIHGGVFATAGFLNSNQPNASANDNKLEIIFHGSQIADNIGNSQINAFGAYTLGGSLPAGSNNETKIFLHGVSQQASVNDEPSVPAESAGTNTITVYN